MTYPLFGLELQDSGMKARRIIREAEAHNRYDVQKRS